MFKKKYKLFYAVTINISLAILSEIFIQIGYFFQELCKKTKVDVFSWTKCINIAILDQYLAIWETIQDRAISVAVFILYIHGVQKN